MSLRWKPAIYDWDRTATELRISGIEADQRFIAALIAGGVPLTGPARDARPPSPTTQRVLMVDRVSGTGSPLA